MRPNISKKEIESGKDTLDLLTQSDPELHPHHLKNLIPEYKHFQAHHQKYGLWSNIKNKKQKFTQKYDKIILLFSGIAAGGKDALKEEMKRLAPGLFIKAVTATSRQPREGEIHGLDYYFFESVEKFKKSIKKGEFFEYIQQGDRFYGLPKKSLGQAINHPAQIVYSELEMSAWSKIEKHFSKTTETKILTVKFFILPHMIFSDYKNWLNQKRDDDVDSRLLRTAWEIKKAPKKSDFIISNRIVENSNCLTYVAQTIINELLDYLSNPPIKKFPIPFNIDKKISDIDQILTLHDSVK